MRRNAMLFCVLIIPVLISAQEADYKPGKFIHLNADVVHSGTIMSKGVILDTDSLIPNLLKSDLKFLISDYNPTTKKYVISLHPSFAPLEFKKDPSKTEVENENARRELIKKDLSSYYNNRTFTVDGLELINKSELYEPLELLTLGALTLPFKFRVQDEMTFETSFNINMLINWLIPWGWNRGLHLQAGSGFGSVKLSNRNTAIIAEGNDIQAETLSLLGGVMYQHKRAQIGIYGGVDYIDNQKNYQWDHHGKLWLAFGIGYQLFKIDLGDKNENKQ